MREGKADVWEAIREELTPPPIEEWEALEPQGMRRSTEPDLPLIRSEDFENAPVGDLPEGWQPLLARNSPDVPQMAESPAELGPAHGKVLHLESHGRHVECHRSGDPQFPAGEGKTRSLLRHVCYHRATQSAVHPGGSELPPSSIHGTTANAGLFVTMNGGRVQALLDAAANTWAFGGYYEPGRWHTVTVDIDIKKQTYLLLHGRRIAAR